MQNDPDNGDYCILRPISRSRSLSRETSEKVSKGNASTVTLCPSSHEQNGSTRRHSPQEEPLLQQNSALGDQTVLLRHQRAMQTQSAHAPESSTAPSHRCNAGAAGRHTKKPVPHKACSWKDKFGTFAIFILISGSILLCAAVGTLAFLWFGNPDIPAWKEITARDWLSKAISICIGVIQQVMMLQLGVVTAIIASLALESRHVVIGDVASVSVMRATASSTGAFVMAWQCITRGQYRGAWHSSTLLVFSAAALWCISQFLVLILLADVSIRSTAGLISTLNLPYNLHYTDWENGSFIGTNNFIKPSTGTWVRKISQYASFAEYTEAPYEADGVSVTGVTLRAFLPFGTAQDRENLKSHKGKATVLDASVSYQVPQFKNVTLDFDEGSVRIQGSLEPTRDTPRLANATFGHSNSTGSSEDPGIHKDRLRDFECLFSWAEIGRTAQAPSNPSPEWQITICQLWQSEHSDQSLGGLVSEFFDPSRMNEASVYAKPYLFLNNTHGYPTTLPMNDSIETLHVPPPPGSDERSEWLDVSYFDFNFSASVCYAAFDFADIDVHISSQSNRTESRLGPVFDRETSTYNFAELRHAMGQDSSLPLYRRGILELEKQEWQAVPQENYTEYTALSWLLRSATDLGSTTTHNKTGLLSSHGDCTNCVEIDIMHQWLFQEIIRTNGSIAFALQTMITVLSSMAYYDQMSQFDKWTQAELAFFKPAQVPVASAGFAVVMLTVALHCSLVAYCVLLFLRNTTSSRLGDSWSAVAQVATGDVLEYLKHATQAGDNNLHARLKADGLESSKVYLEEVHGEVSISISGKDGDK